MVADGVPVGAGIRRGPLAGRIDPFSVVDRIEILPALLLDIRQQRMRRIRRRAGALPNGQARQLMKPLLDSKAQQFVRKFHTRQLLDGPLRSHENSAWGNPGVKSHE
jgi:hypothetical protein